MDLESELRPPARVRLSGDLDVFRKEEIKSSLPEPAAVRSIAIDCLRVRYVDSTIIGMLVGLRRDFIAAGGLPRHFSLLMVRNSIVHRAFNLAGVLKLFAVEYTDETVRITVGGNAARGTAPTP